MTQAVNLANFANNLDSSGGLSPSALNAAVAINKGGTASTTASAARTALGVDYVTIGQLMYPVGSVYINAGSTTNPATLLGFGTWVAFGAGRVMVSLDGADSLFDTLEETGGSKDAIAVSHTHSFSATTSNAGSHTHTATRDMLGEQAGPFAWNSGSYATKGSSFLNAAGDHNHTVSGTTGSTGSSGINANIQPYITVAMWKRTA